MYLVIRIVGIAVLLMLGSMFLMDYWELQEPRNPAALTVAEVKRVATRDLPRYFILKDAVRKNLASIESAGRKSVEIMYPVYTKEEAMDTSFDGTLRNEAVVFVMEPLRTDTSLIQVHALFQPVSYRVRRVDGPLTEEERRLFDEQDIRLGKDTVKLVRGYPAQNDVTLGYALLCLGGAVLIGVSMGVSAKRKKA